MIRSIGRAESARPAQQRPDFRAGRALRRRFGRRSPEVKCVSGAIHCLEYGMLVPAGTPTPVVDRLQTDTASVIRLPSIRARFAAQGIEIYGTSPAEFKAYLDVQMEKCDKLVQAAGVQIN